MLNIEEKYPHKYAFLQLGFRPFFLAALGFAVISIVLWMALYIFHIAHQPAYPAMLWHAHEMIYGYGLAVAAGFLLTAVKNWTGVQTIQGTPLLVLLLLWFIARVFSFNILLIHPYALVASDLLFNLFLCIAILAPIIKTKSWQHIAIVSKIVLLLIAHVVFYLGYLGIWPAGLNYGLYAGLYLILALIFTMGRRVIPFFIEKGVDNNFTPQNKVWMDISSLVLFLVYAIVKIIHLDQTITSALAAILFVLHSYRLYGWYTHGIWSKTLVWSLFLGYSWIVIAFLMDALSLFFNYPPYLSTHAFAFGGIGIITAAMMARVALGHSGRSIADPPKILGFIFSLLWLGVFIRVILPIYYTQSYTLFITIAQVLWITAFIAMTITYLPILIKARVDGRPG
ncbi:MAG: NnrS family protein [Thiotrichaceae bacterium]|nr:NnrS family protein [Thiotrichaceae bacterium]